MNDFKWLFEKRIIHRGMINESCIDHARDSFITCMQYSYPLEIDLLILDDGEIVVWRDGRLASFGIENDFRMLSSVTLEIIRDICRMDRYAHSSLNQMMTLNEFLDMIDGKLNLLIEIKEPYNSQTIQQDVSSALNILNHYTGKYALHSAHPEVLRLIREMSPSIPIGQISWSFNGTDVSEEYRKLHQNFDFMNIIKPDFLGYDIRELQQKTTLDNVNCLCEKNHLPLIAWTVRNKNEEIFAKKYCNNMIIEGAPSFL